MVVVGGGGGGVIMSGLLAETVETGTKNRCLIEATHVLRRKLRKIKFRAFPRRVGPRITLKQVNTTEWLKTKK